MLKKITLMTLVVVLMLALAGCQTVRGVGCLIKGAGQDLAWAGEQMTYLGQGQLYYAEVGGKRVYFRKIDIQPVVSAPQQYTGQTGYTTYGQGVTRGYVAAQR